MSRLLTDTDKEKRLFLAHNDQDSFSLGWREQPAGVSRRFDESIVVLSISLEANVLQMQ
jgi:hypothetical protein